MNKDGKMDRLEFSIAMKLIKLKLQGTLLPSALPIIMKQPPVPAPTLTNPTSTLTNPAYGTCLSLNTRTEKEMCTIIYVNVIEKKFLSVKCLCVHFDVSSKLCVCVF